MIREGVPDPGGRGEKGPVSHGPEICTGLKEEVGAAGPEVPRGCVRGEEVFKVDWGIAMDAEVGEERNFVVDSGGYGEPVEVLKNGSDVFMFTDLHENTGSTVLDELKFLKIFLGRTNEQTVAVVKFGLSWLFLRCFYSHLFYGDT